MNEKMLYGRIDREWEGVATRLHMPHLKGIPDYHLTTPNSIGIFAEVKLILGSGYLKSSVSKMQLFYLRKLRLQGAYALVLYGHEKSGWIVHPVVPGMDRFESVLDLGQGVAVPRIGNWVTLEEVGSIWDEGLRSGL